MTIKTMKALTPTDKTLKLSIETEELSLTQAKRMLTKGKFDPNILNVLLKALNTVGKMRINQRAEVSLKTRIFRDVSTSKGELKMYIEASFPEIFPRTTKKESK